MKKQEKALEEISCDCKTLYSCKICSSKLGVLHKVNQLMLEQTEDKDVIDNILKCEQEIINEINKKKKNRTNSTGPRP